MKTGTCGKGVKNGSGDVDQVWREGDLRRLGVSMEISEDHIWV